MISYFQAFWAPLFASLRRKTAARPFLPFAMCNKAWLCPIIFFYIYSARLHSRSCQPKAFGQHRDMQQNFANLISLYSIFTSDSIEYFDKFLPFCNSIQALPPILSQPPQTASSLSTIGIQPHLETLV